MLRKILFPKWEPVRQHVEGRLPLPGSCVDLVACVVGLCRSAGLGGGASVAACGLLHQRVHRVEGTANTQHVSRMYCKGAGCAELKRAPGPACVHWPPRLQAETLQPLSRLTNSASYSRLHVCTCCLDKASKYLLLLHRKAVECSSSVHAGT